ncbi:hypothetical protein [Ferruginibacter sp. HRS2-29]
MCNRTFSWRKNGRRCGTK